jgi:hypothetical protein
MSKATKQQKDMYAKFMAAFTSCWSCGWRGEFRNWMWPRLENAHIRGGEGRTHDRRNICRLCNGCHRLNTGERIVVNGEPLRNLELCHMLWLKLQFDPEFYDPEYLNSLRPRRVPEPESWSLY